VNLYSYALNNPLTFIDPTGMYCDYSDHSDPQSGFDQLQFDYHSNTGECKDNGGQWVNDAYTHHGQDDTNRPEEAVSALSKPPAPGKDPVFDIYVSMDQRWLASRQLQAAPTPGQYMKAIADVTGNIPNVCAFGIAAYLGVGGRAGLGVSADTKNGVKPAGGANLGMPNGAGPSVSFGGSSGNVNYSAPIPDTPFAAYVGTHNGDINQIQSVGVNTRVGKFASVSAYADIGTFGDPNCK
jgi:hypothetical protein